MNSLIISSYTINGLPVQTGDIVCTQNGAIDENYPEAIRPGEFWCWVSQIVPGEVDHVAVYIGPEGRCIEASGRGVISLMVEDGWWNAPRMMDERGRFLDTFYGIVYPLQGCGLPLEEERRIRFQVAAYCLAQVGKPYNLNLLNIEQDHAFYCSQLLYKAYQPHGINLNSAPSIRLLPGTQRIVYPQEIWDVCPHRRPDMPGETG